jgi:XTP/dITP diphosphohydrolase
MLENREFVLATNNDHKLREIRRLFPGFTVLSPAEAGVEFSYTEGEESYLANALGKALALHARIRRPVLADDSGLDVPVLGGEPGLRSARYGSGELGRRLTDREKIDYLLRKMAGRKERACFFVCCLVLVVEQERFLVVQEAAHGSLALTPSGSGGFGYDPVFLLPGTGKTMAELTDREKDEVSHRGRAARRLRALLGEE